MRTPRVFAFALIGLATIVGCSEVPDSVDEAISSLPAEEDVTAAAENVQSEIDNLTEEIENSEAADDLRTSWGDLRSEVQSAVASFTAGEQIDGDALQAEFDEFQAEIDAVADDVSDELVAAWNSLREQVEELTG